MGSALESPFDPYNNMISRVYMSIPKVSVNEHQERNLCAYNKIKYEEKLSERANCKDDIGTCTYNVYIDNYDIIYKTSMYMQIYALTEINRMCALKIWWK